MRRHLALLILTVPVLLLAPRYETVPDDGIPWEFGTPPRTVAIGDVHADPRMLASILRNRKLIDPDGHWVGGPAHLVLMGDLVDRGPDSRTVLDLVMRLEKEALVAGGRVHTLIGNHDVAIAEGRLKYASASELKGYEDFQGSPTARHLRQQNPQLTREQSGFQAAFVGDTPYAEFLRRRNAVIRIGDTLYAHGGLNKWATRVDMGELNSTVRAGIRYHQDRAQGRRDAVKLTDRQVWVLEDEGPLWDREVSESVLRQKDVDNILSHLYAERLVLGHTMTESDEIETRYGEKVFLIDTGGSVAQGGRPSALEITGDRKENHATDFIYYGTGAIERRNKIRRLPERSCARIYESLKRPSPP